MRTAYIEECCFCTGNGHERERTIAVEMSDALDFALVGH